MSAKRGSGERHSASVIDNGLKDAGLKVAVPLHDAECDAMKADEIEWLCVSCKRARDEEQRQLDEDEKLRLEEERIVDAQHAETKRLHRVAIDRALHALSDKQLDSHATFADLTKQVPIVALGLLPRPAHLTNLLKQPCFA